MLFRHYFWDFDGTLYNTYGRISRAVQKGLREEGLEADIDSVYNACKHSLHYAWETLAAPRGIPEEAYTAAYRRHAEEEGPDSFVPFPGMPETLRALSASGACHYLYTHRNQTAAECLVRHGLWELFTDEVNSNHAFPLKPAPDALLYLMEKHRLDPADCVMVGDRPIDVEAARNAGMHGILFDPGDFYADYPAAMRVRSMAGIPALVQA